MTTPSKILVVDDEEDLELLMRQRFRRQVRRGEYGGTLLAAAGLHSLAPPR